MLIYFNFILCYFIIYVFYYIYRMAPEVIQEAPYDGKADIWSAGITAIEMAEMLPPYANVHPMRVLFMLPRNPSPTLHDKEKWSPKFHAFLSRCLDKDRIRRPSADELLHDPFLLDIDEVSISKSLSTLIEQSGDHLLRKGFSLYDSESDYDDNSNHSIKSY